MSTTIRTASDANEDSRKRSVTDARQDRCSKRWSGTNGKARTRMSIEDVIAIIDDLYREGVIDYMQAWELRMRVRAKGADDD